MKNAVLLLLILGVGCMVMPQVVEAEEEEWEHGWQTSHVRATRYKNDVMGYNIGFIYLLNPNDCDREELFDFMKEHGGAVFQAGGYRGAEMFVVFGGVKDRTTANKKLREILPSLTRIVQGF